MELQFVKQGSRYIAEFQTTGDFNLHIEREESGYLYVNQRTPETGKYDSVKGGAFNYGDSEVDKDFSFLVYPKQIQVVSKVLPTMAIVTAAEGGEVGYSDTQISETLNTPV